MTALDLLNNMVQEAGSRYENFVSGLRLLYANAITHPNFGTAGHRTGIMNLARKAGKDFLDAEASEMELDVDEIFGEAFQTTIAELRSGKSEEVPVLVSEHLQATLDYLFSEAQAQVQRDISSLQAQLQAAIFHISVASRARNTSFKSSQMEYRLFSAEGVKFGFRDRAGKTWNSERFYRTFYRQSLLSVYNETVVIVLADHGLTRAEVYHLDGKAEVDGMIIAFSPNGELPTYSEIRDVVFHPNANAILRMEPGDVYA